MIKGALVLLMATAMGAGAKAQYAWDIGMHLGGANYLGEMGGKEKPRRDFIWDLKMNQTRWAVGGFARRKINRFLSLNSGIMYFRLQGADINSENPARVGRNLNFRNDMFELYLRPEFTLFQDNDLGGHGRYKTDFRLFAYVGGSIYYSNPKAKGFLRDGSETAGYVALRDLQTEMTSYSSIGVAIPAGVGMHFTIRRRHRIGWDFGWRTTFSDYIDDVSTTYADKAVLEDAHGALAADMSTQSHYLPDVDPALAGTQVETQNGTVVTVPNEIQYGFDDKRNVGLKRGDPTHNDSYLTMTFTYSYVLRGQSNFYRQRYNWMRGKKRIGRKSRAKF